MVREPEVILFGETVEALDLAQGSDDVGYRGRPRENGLEFLLDFLGALHEDPPKGPNSDRIGLV
jgi:hypothetical protein